LHSIGHIGKLQRLTDNDADFVSPLDMLAELREDNLRLAASMRKRTALATSTATSRPRALLEVWIDEAERRAWFLFEASRKGDEPGR